MDSNKTIKECVICHKIVINPKKSQFIGQTCSKCREKYRIFLMKQKAVEYLGGKCSICGYNKCNRALDFHHINPEEKDNTISSLYNYSWDNIKKELDKCILLCANCHRELHTKERLAKLAATKKLNLQKSTSVISEDHINLNKQNPKDEKENGKICKN
mgnify:CR=1 FL=1